jgi:Leucine-rich repeat (LRR) protein
VSQNKISSIPPSLIQVKTLATIDFADNQLTEVPEGVSSLPSLTNLFVQVTAPKP